MGIIDSLSTGFRVAMRRLELLVLPLFLDVLLWFLPRLSVEPLLGRLASFYREMSGAPELAGSELSAIGEQMTEVLTLAGQNINLWQFLVSRTLYHVPSLLATFPGLLSGRSAVTVNSVLDAGQLVLALGLLGLLIGVLYMNLLARSLPIGEGEKSTSVGGFMRLVVMHWLRTIGLVIGVFFTLLAIYIPAVVLISLMMLVSPPLGSGAMVLVSGLVAILFFYLYFTTVGLVLDDLPIRRAVMRSMRLVRHNFWPTLGLILLMSVISAGMGLLLVEIADRGPLGTVLAAVANAFIGTGLAVALLVFYRTRVLVMTGVSQPQRVGP